MNVVLLLYDFYWNCVVVLYKLPLLNKYYSRVLPVVASRVAIYHGIKFDSVHRRREIPNLEFFPTNTALQIDVDHFFCLMSQSKLVHIQIGVFTLILVPNW
jgi:hypothetical protein